MLVVCRSGLLTVAVISRSSTPSKWSHTAEPVDFKQLAKHAGAQRGIQNPSDKKEHLCKKQSNSNEQR